MASELKVNTLTGVSTAGSIAVTGEGNSTTTNLQQGLAKVWVNFDHDGLSGTSTTGVRDSLNLTSMTDNATGDATITIANDMANDDYSATATGYHPSASFGFITSNDSTFFATGSLRIETVEHDGGHKQTEHNVSCVTIHGDLA